MATTRRSFLKKTSGTVLAFSFGGTTRLMTPRDARAEALPLQVLTNDEAAVLDAVGEALVPGAAHAGIAHFIDHQLAADPNECLLIARYFNLEPPYLGFYRGALEALSRFCQARYGNTFAALDAETQRQVLKTISESHPEGWDGPPAPLAYLLLRSDAVDVVYGTPQGFDELGIPYMPHIMPPQTW